jgi:hypothetical protein
MSHSNFSTVGLHGPGSVSATPTDEAGNQSTAPLFVDAPAGNYREEPSSPTHRAGDLGAVEPGDLDLDGNALETTCDGSPYVDIGAYELAECPAVTLKVARAGGGSGTVTSSPAGVSCGTTCETSFAYGTEVTLTAQPATGSTFSGWSGTGCSGTGSCTVTMTALREVTATFGLEQTTQPGSSTSLETSSSTPPAPAPSAPVLSKLALKPRKFERKTKISFSLSAPATVKLEVLRKVKKKGKTKTVKVGTLPQVSGKAGANKVSFNGKLKGKALAPGKYTLRATATAAGLNSKPLTTAFEILK